MQNCYKEVFGSEFSLDELILSGIYEDLKDLHLLPGHIDMIMFFFTHLAIFPRLRRTLCSEIPKQ